MDLFKYQLELARIDSAKYVKDLRELVYHCHNDNSGYYSHQGTFEQESAKWLNYKLYAKTYNAYYAKSNALLPDKFKFTLIHRQKQLLDWNVTEATSFSYEQLLDLFEFDIHVDSPQWTESELFKFCNIVGTNLLPFELHINTYVSNLSTTKYFNNLRNPSELAILTWMKVNGIPESFTVANLFREQYKYRNTVANQQPTLAERANIVLALESIDQLTGEPIYDQQQ